MRALILQHVHFEGPGSISTWLEQQGANISCCRLYQGERLPDTTDINLLVVMGGPMSVNDEEQYPWLREEKAFIRRTAEAGRPVLGICLGAQLIASALGAAVYPNQHKEIGWFPISGMSDSGDRFHFPWETVVFHWHGETFDLPAGAMLLASSELCRNQAFQIGRTVIGLQFHLEVTPATVGLMIDNCRDELVAGTAIQDEATLRAALPQTYAAVNALMAKLLTYLTASP